MSRYGGLRRNIAIGFGNKKIEWHGAPIVKKIEDMITRFDTFRIFACSRHDNA